VYSCMSPVRATSIDQSNPALRERSPSAINISKWTDFKGELLNQNCWGNLL
jgi:hypothetical protein